MPSLFSTPSKPALEFKGNLLTLMVLHLFETDNEKITEQLAEKVSKAPGFFQHAPVIIDLHALHDDNHKIDFAELVRLLRSHGLIPVAIRGGNPQQNETATSLNLGLLRDTKTAAPQHAPEVEPVTDEINEMEEPVAVDPVNVTPSSLTCKIVRQQVRSGQQIVALQGDLVVLAPVSHGAEILAQGHIHVYGALRGRALAGVNGDSQARIFCQQLDAELISIAGQYQVNEELPKEFQNKAVQIYLEDDNLKFEPL
jgi:septum site-determining protein MinC